MKEFIDKLIEKLNDRMEHLDSRHKILTDAGLFKESDKIAYKMVEVDFIKQIVNQLAEEYQNDNLSQLSNKYWKCLTKFGVDITEKWETATQNAVALEQAYIRGRQDERDKFAKWQDEYKGGWIPCSERLPSREEYLKNDGRFIVTDGNRCYQSVFDIYSQVFRTSVFTTFGSYRYEEDKCVIAWMPLPAPYTEGE